MSRSSITFMWLEDYVVHKLLDSVEDECLDNQQIEGDFTTVILCCIRVKVRL